MPRNFLQTVGALQPVGRAVKLPAATCPQRDLAEATLLQGWPQGSETSLAIGQSSLVFLGISLPTGHLGTMGVPSRHSEQDQKI